MGVVLHRGRPITRKVWEGLFCAGMLWWWMCSRSRRKRKTPKPNKKKRGRNHLQKDIVIFNAWLSVCACERYMLYKYMERDLLRNEPSLGWGWGCWDRVNARAIDRSSC